MIVYLARHAWAGHYGDPAWPDDSQRPLTPDGVVRYRRMVRRLVEEGFAPERIATSPYVRCSQTAELIAAASEAPVETLDELSPGAGLLPLLGWAAASACDAVCLVGHNPDCERLLGQMVSDRSVELRFAKGSVAAVRYENAPSPSDGELLWHWTAKRLGV